MSLAAWMRPRFSPRMRKRARPAKRWLNRPGRVGFQTTRMIRWTFLPVVGVEVDALVRPADRDGDLASGVDAGVRQGDARTDGRGNEVLAVDDAGQQQLLVVDELLLGQHVQELFDGLDLVLALEVEDDLAELEVIRELGDMGGGFILHYRRSLAHSAKKTNPGLSRPRTSPPPAPRAGSRPGSGQIRLNASTVLRSRTLPVWVVPSGSTTRT